MTNPFNKTRWTREQIRAARIAPLVPLLEKRGLELIAREAGNYSLGLVLGVVVTPADCPERDGARQVLQRVGDWFRRWRKLWGDGGYRGDTFAQWVGEHWPKLEVEVVKRSAVTVGFAVLPQRWIVERTFGWLMRHRRLVRDYERTEASAESWIHLAMIRIQLRRLA